MTLLLLISCGKESEDLDSPKNDYLDAIEKEFECLLKPECLVILIILENEENEKCKKSAEWYIFKGGSRVIPDFCANSRRYDIFTVKPIQPQIATDDSDYLIPGKLSYIPSTGYKAYKNHKPLSEIQNGDVFEEVSDDYILRDNSGGFYLLIEDKDITYGVLLPYGRQFALKGVKR